MSTIPLFQRLASHLVNGYIRHCPVARGKYRLMWWASSFLVVDLEAGMFIRVSDPSNPIAARIVREGLLEAEDLGFFLSLLEPGMTVLDIGANIGQYTLLAARRVGGAGRVHAFEPTPGVAANLRRNVALNGLENVVVNELAVSDSSGLVRFFMHPEECDVNTLVGAHAEGVSIDVPAVTLDGYVTDQRLPAVDVVKMDIEGAEAMALRGGRALLAGERAPVMFLEVNPEALGRAGTTAGGLARQLGEYGYTCYALTTYSGGSYSNVLATKPWHWGRFPAIPQKGLKLAVF